MRAFFDTERITREDLVLFVNACFACNGQSEFYGGSGAEEVSIRFLHEYISGNYRRLYARTLAAGINHFNQGQILVNLLSSGAAVPAADRQEESALITAALRALPPQRAFRVLRELRERRVNNRRTRSVIRGYLAGRRDPNFDAVKYRAHVRALAAHAHLLLPGEVGSFVFEGIGRKGAFETPLFESFRRAHYAEEAIYDLPYSIAEGFADRHGVPRERFLERIAPKMTQGERLRLQGTAEEQEVELDVDLSRAPLTRLAVYLLSLPLEVRRARRDELHEAMRQAAGRALRRAPMRLGRVATVLDRSYSTSGSGEKRRRPLAVALAASYLLRAAATEYHPFWTGRGRSGQEDGDEVMVTPRGQTDLGATLLDALAVRPDLVVIVSDGFENDPPNGAAEVARIFRKRLDPGRRTSLVHMNPVFDSDRFMPRSLGAAVPTVGLRDAEDLLTMLGFARFAEGSAPLEELEDYLEARVRRLLRPREQGRGGDAAEAAT